MSSQERRPDGTYTPKRYVGAQNKITLELTDFEAMFLAQRLWEIAEVYEAIDQTSVEEEIKLWSRRLHSERKTREN